MVRVTKNKYGIFNYPKTILAIIIYKFILDITYNYYLSNRWLFMGYINNGNTKEYLLSWFLLFLIVPLIIKNLYLDNISSLYISAFNFIVLIPNLTIIGYYKYTDFYYIILFVLYWIFLNFFNLVISRFNIRSTSTQNNIIYNIILIIVVLVILFISYKYTRFRIDLNIFNAYDYRYEAENYNISGIMEYLFSMARNVLPIFIIERFHNKKYLQSLMLLFVGLLAYSVTGSKSVLFSYIIIFVVYFAFRGNNLSKIPFLLITLLIIAVLEILIYEKSFIIDVLIRRVFFIPGLLTYYYYDFFKYNQFDYFRQGILGRLGLSSPYTKSIPKIIGDNYFLGAYANAGLFSDAYYNLGTLGIIIMPLIIILLIRIIEAFSSGIDKRIVYAGSITIIFSLINSSFFTALITHGSLAVIIIFFFMNRNEDYQYGGESK